MTTAAVRRRAPVWACASSSALSLAAVGIASYLTFTHYADPAALACPDTGVVNCALVTTSSWSVMLGVPVAVLGLVWALAMTALTTPWAWRAEPPWVAGTRFVLAGAGAAMVVYLIYVELFRVGAVCVWCTAVHLTALGLFGVVLAVRADVKGRVPLGR
jgi:uncharacterized membrane protein